MSRSIAEMVFQTKLLEPARFSLCVQPSLKLFPPVSCLSLHYQSSILLSLHGLFLHVPFSIKITVVQTRFIIFISKLLIWSASKSKGCFKLTCCWCNTEVIDSVTLISSFVRIGLQGFSPRKQLFADLE